MFLISKSDTEYDSTFGVDQIRIDEADYRFGSLWLARQYISEPFFYVFVVAEPPCYSEDYCQDRDYCQESGVGECGSVVYHSFCCKTLNGQYQHSKGCDDQPL